MLTLATAGLKAPPHGTPSTTSRNASNSRNPQNSGTALAGPASLPGAIATPAASARASFSDLTPRALKSLPLITSIEAGTSCDASGRRVATTSTGGRDTAGFGGSSCPAAGVGSDRIEASEITLIRDERRLSMFLRFFGGRTGWQAARKCRETDKLPKRT